MVHLTSPYVPEYLAFREVKFLVELLSTMEKQKPDLLPQVKLLIISHLFILCCMNHLIIVLITEKKLFGNNIMSSPWHFYSN